MYLHESDRKWYVHISLKFLLGRYISQKLKKEAFFFAYESFNVLWKELICQCWGQDPYPQNRVIIIHRAQCTACSSESFLMSHSRQLHSPARGGWSGILLFSTPYFCCGWLNLPNKSCHPWASPTAHCHVPVPPQHCCQGGRKARD